MTLLPGYGLAVAGASNYSAISPVLIGRTPAVQLWPQLPGAVDPKGQGETRKASL
jgi:hypothetical protein